MDENDFDVTLVLEKLVTLGTLDAFYDAVDSDDFAKARALLRQAGIDGETIAIVLKQMADPDIS